MRYTEARLTPIAMEMLADLEKDTVDFMPNYDETLQEPRVLPGKFPNLLCNGSSGIAVGMATNIPPHNLREIVDALGRGHRQSRAVDNEVLLKYVSGPDFPTGGIIYGRDGIREPIAPAADASMSAPKPTSRDCKNGKEQIVVSEIPYQVNKSNLIEKIADLVRNKTIEGISDLRDESDRDGMRIVIELKRDVQPQIVLNQLFKHTQMQATFGVIMISLVDGAPKVLPLRSMLEEFIKHRHEVVVRRAKFDLKKAEDRAHILEGLRIALDNIDAVIATHPRFQDRSGSQRGLDVALQAFRDSGAGNSRDAPPAPHWSGTPENRRRIPRTDPADRIPQERPRQSGYAHADHQDRTD